MQVCAAFLMQCLCAIEQHCNIHHHGNQQWEHTWERDAAYSGTERELGDKSCEYYTVTSTPADFLV